MAQKHPSSLYSSPDVTKTCRCIFSFTLEHAQPKGCCKLQPERQCWSSYCKWYILNAICIQLQEVNLQKGKHFTNSLILFFSKEQIIHIIRHNIGNIFFLLMTQRETEDTFHWKATVASVISGAHRALELDYYIDARNTHVLISTH